MERSTAGGGHTGKFLPWNLLYKVLWKQKIRGKGQEGGHEIEGSTEGKRLCMNDKMK